jgi:glycosyltransferase involved in cell wall biosynthesis
LTTSPTASVAIPTRRRPDYLDVALKSIVPQVTALGAEVLVIDDGGDPATTTVAQQHGARIVTLPTPSGLNAARNAAVAAARGPLIVFVDDDVEAREGWLAALLKGAQAAPDHDVFGGPIDARLEGRRPPGCGLEKPPITTLDLGADDRDVSRVWGANLAIRADALARVGGFDESIVGTGDEEDWQRRYLEQGGRIRYLADARLTHRRSAADAKLSRLARAAFTRGRQARRYDVRRDATPRLQDEARTLLGCIWHALRRRCALGLVSAAHSAGRLREAVASRRT